MRKGRPSLYQDGILEMLRAAGPAGVTMRDLEAALSARGSRRSTKGAALTLVERGEAVRRMEMANIDGMIFRQYRYWAPEAGPTDAERA